MKAPIWQYKYSFLCISFFSILLKLQMYNFIFKTKKNRFFSMLYTDGVYGLINHNEYTCVFKWFSMRLLKYGKSLKFFFSLNVRVAHSFWIFNGFVCILLTITAIYGSMFKLCHDHESELFNFFNHLFG